MPLQICFFILFILFILSKLRFPNFMIPA